MKSYNEVASAVFRRRDAYEKKKLAIKAGFRRFSIVMSVVAIAVMLFLSAGTCYVLAAGIGIIDDFLGFFDYRNGTHLSENQQQFIEERVAEIGESITCNGYTVTARGAFTDGTMACILLDIAAPQGVVIENLSGLGFDIDIRDIIRGDNSEKILKITGIHLSCIPMEDYDGQKNTVSMMIRASCIRMLGSKFSFADGYKRYLNLGDFHHYLKEYPYSCTTISEGSWNFEILFDKSQEWEAELLSSPIRGRIQRITLADYVDATISSIRLKSMGLMCYYTIDADDIQEAGDFGTIQIVLKDGNIIPVYPHSVSAVAGTNTSATYCCYYLSRTPIVSEEVDHVVFGDDLVLSVPQTTTPCE